MTKETIRKLQEVDSLLSRLIAEKEGIYSEQVSVKYIHEKREKVLYKIKRYDICSTYGGYDLTGLKVLTGNELDEIEARTETFLCSFV